MNGEQHTFILINNPADILTKILSVGENRYEGTHVYVCHTYIPKIVNLTRQANGNFISMIVLWGVLKIHAHLFIYFENYSVPKI